MGSGWIYHLLVFRGLCGYTSWPYGPWVIFNQTSSTAGGISGIYTS